MESQLESLGNRFIYLLGDANGWSDYTQAIDSPEELFAMEENNRRQFEKIKAMPEERQLRIKESMFNMLATILQEKALEKWGNTDTSSLEQCLYECFGDLELQGRCNRINELTRQGLAKRGFTDEEIRVVDLLRELFSLLMPKRLVQEIGHLRLLPRAQSPGIAAVLANMMMEARV